MSEAVRLRALLGDYPVTAALKNGTVRSPHVALEFADVKVPNTAFKRVVRDLEFDVAAPQRLGLRGVWLDRAGAGVPATADVVPHRVVRDLSGMLS